MSAKLRVAAIVAALVMICGLEFLVIRPSADPLPLQPLPLIVAAWILFAGAAWLLRGISVRWSVALIIIGGIAIQVVAMSAPPQSSDDMYRYMWDGRVQAAGIDPYAYVPSAPQLAHLRDPFLWTAARGELPVPALCLAGRLASRSPGGQADPGLHADKPPDGTDHLSAGRGGLLLGAALRHPGARRVDPGAGGGGGLRGPGDARTAGRAPLAGP